MSLPLSEVSVNKQTHRHLRAERVALQYLASRDSVKVTLFLLLSKNVLCYVSESEERRRLALGCGVFGRSLWKRLGFDVNAHWLMA